MSENWQSKIPAKRRGYWLEGAGKFRQALTLHGRGAMQGVVSAGSGVTEGSTWGGMESAAWQRCAHPLTQLGVGVGGRILGLEEPPQWGCSARAREKVEK